MSGGVAAGRGDFVQPVRGVMIWRGAAKRAIVGSSAGAAHAIAGDRDLDPDARAPDFIEPVVGWRIWRAVRCDGRYVLASIVSNTAWVPARALDAQCLVTQKGPGHDAPDRGCCCGVYASRHDALDWHMLGRRSMTPLVVGRVSLWGPVVEAARGWRAARGYPERLFVPRAGSRLTRRDYRVAGDLEAYGVPAAAVLVDDRSAIRSVLEALCPGPRAPVAATA
jgi:hypothetical protein